MNTSRKPSAAVAERFAADRRRRRTIWASLVATAVLVAAGFIGYRQYNHRPHYPVRFPAGVAASDDTGVARGAGGAVVDVYLDFLCPNCREFDKAAAPLLDEAVTRRRAIVVVHPVAFLDRMSRGSEYSTRASAASGCAADGGKFSAYAVELLRRQPAENTRGLSDEDLITIGTGLGLNERFAACVRNKTYRGWATHVTEKSVRRGVTSTPTIMVDGKLLDPEPRLVADALGITP